MNVGFAPPLSAIMNLNEHDRSGAVTPPREPWVWLRGTEMLRYAQHDIPGVGCYISSCRGYAHLYATLFS